MELEVFSASFAAVLSLVFVLTTSNINGVEDVAICSRSIEEEKVL